MVVSDNLKSGITKACFYEPNVNRTYADMAKHYGIVVIPARSPSSMLRSVNWLSRSMPA